MRVHLVWLLALSGCVTTELHKGAENVRVTSNADAVKGCKFVGEVTASDRMNGGLVGMDAAEENTYRRLKNSALAPGANVVHLGRSDSSVAGASARGEAYRCED